MTKNVIVFGGTGHQGSAFVRALAAANDPTHVHPAFAIHVLVRDPEAHSAERLIKLPGVKLVHSPHYMEAPDEAFDAAGLSVGDVHGAFMVNGYMDGDKETAQGVRVVKSAAAYGVKHFVYASVMFDESKEVGNDGLDPKRAVERAIKATNMGWTMLRDTDFMDNWLANDGLVGRVWRTILLNKTFIKHPGRKIPMCATRDIGRIGALALTNGDKYLNKAIPIIGDWLNTDEIQAIYKEVMGTPIVQSWGATCSLALWTDANTAKLAKFYDSEQGWVNIDKSVTAEVLPDVEDFRSFLERNKREEAIRKATE